MHLFTLASDISLSPSSGTCDWVVQRAGRKINERAEFPLLHPLHWIVCLPAELKLWHSIISFIRHLNTFLFDVTYSQEHLSDDSVMRTVRIGSAAHYRCLYCIVLWINSFFLVMSVDILFPRAPRSHSCEKSLDVTLDGWRLSQSMSHEQ